MRQARKQANPGLRLIARDAGFHGFAAALDDAISFHVLRFYLCGFIHQPQSCLSDSDSPPLMLNLSRAPNQSSERLC